ncbi:hypothetical protein LCGC14_2613880 [marine sediment metagenome]|uniref:Uncharacterized protein n=1 Tax=marine sediment metagenome TaxID=412755 RepID=A0A0F9ASR3_9ZZZZ
MEFVAVSGWIWTVLEILAVIGVLLLGVRFVGSHAKERKAGLERRNWRIARVILMLLAIVATVSFIGASNKWRPRSEPETRQTVPSRVIPTVVPAIDFQREDSDALQDTDEKTASDIKDRFNSLPDAD